MTSDALPPPPQAHPRTIDQRTLKIIVGLIALTLAYITNFFSMSELSSISASYYEGGWAQTFFVGSLFAISSFLLAYNGYWPSEMALSKLAALAGLCIALFPCECNGHDEIIRGVHGIAAAAMFLVLAYFCFGFFSRARQKGTARSKARMLVYGLCGISIAGAILAALIDYLLHHEWSNRYHRFTFWVEWTGLMAFGISWLTASRFLPLITDRGQQFLPWRSSNPPDT